MAGIIPNQSSGGLPAGSSLVTNNPGVQPATFNLDCSQLGLPNDCTARITPSQINAIVSELLNLAAAMTPDGTWSCTSLDNLASAFENYMSGSGANTLQTAILSALNWRNCANVQHGAVAIIPTCAEMNAAISAAIVSAVGALPPEKYVASAAFNSPDLILTLTDGSTVTADLSDLSATLVNSANGSSTITVDGVSACFVRCGLRNEVIPDALTVGIPKRIAPRSNDLMPQGSVATIVSTVDCVVVVNADGTHTVTADTTSCDSGEWSYTYTVPGAPAPATVSGTVDNVQVVTTLAVTGSLSPNFTVTTTGGASYDVDWGDGSGVQTVASGAAATHNYASAFTGNITISAPECSPVRDFVATTGTGNFSFNLSALPATLRTFELHTPNTTRGNISSLPAELVRYINKGSNITLGNISSLPSSLAVYENEGNNTTNGDVSLLPNDLVRYINLGSNTTTGDIGALPSDLLRFENGGSNTTSGSIATLPSTLTYYRNLGSNTTSGSVAALPAGLTYYENAGNNTTSGSVASLPAGLTVYHNLGNNTTSGSVASLPAGLFIYINNGNNTTSGSVSLLPPNLIQYSNGGNNTTAGNIAALPATLTLYSNVGFNTVSGAIGSLPAGLVRFISRGNNTTSGNINTLPPNMTIYHNEGNNTTTATSNVWSMATAGFRSFVNAGTVARTQAVVDFMLQAAANVTSWATERTVDVSGANAAPSATGLAAKTTILGNGALVVLHN